MPSNHLSVLMAVAACAVITTPSHAQRGRVPSESVYSDQFSVGPGGTLRVDVDDADIEVQTSGGSGVEVEVVLFSRDMEWARDRFEQMEFTARAEGNTVRVTAREPRRRRRSDWRDNRWFSMTVRITVPQRFDVDARTADGDILLGDLNGSIWLDTSDGDVDLGRIQGDQATIETSDGDVTAISLASARTSIRTSDGDIEIDAVDGDFEATSGDGDISVYLGAVEGVNVRTGDGDISLYIPAALRATVDLSAEDLYVPRAFTIQGRISRRRVRGDLNGGGPRIQASTGDGSIRLRESRNP